VRDAWLDDWAGSARAFRQSAALLPTPQRKHVYAW